VQTTGLPPTHVPLWQLSVRVQGLLSLHAVPVCAAQVPVVAEQAVHVPQTLPVFSHCPLALHVCGCGPLHRLLCGTHSPVQAPLLELHTKSHFGPISVHWPIVSHDCGCVPLHRFIAGVQTPVQAPLAQTNGHAMPPLAHCPVSVQVCG
jgi:hypothetical protein